MNDALRAARADVWTSNPPTVPGWYWFKDGRYPLSGEQRIKYIEKDDIHDAEWWGPTAQFCGPINPPAAALDAGKEG